MIIKANNKRTYILTFFLTAILFLIIFAIYGITPFGNNSICTNDGVAQYIPFISDLHEKLKNGENIFYSFNGALGYNMFGTIAYYLMSPFTFITLFFNKSDMKTAVQFIIMLKMCFVAVGMNWYLLNRFKKKNYILSICFSLAYAFSYFFIGYMYNFMWLDCIIFLPFILRGLETINTTKGKILYISFLSLSMISNFYLSVIVCIFLFIYYWLIIDFKNIKDLIIKTINFGISSILSAGIASFVLIPMGVNLLSTGSSRTRFPEFEFFNDFLYVFQRHLPFIEIKTLSTNNGDVNLFCTMAVFILAALFLFNNSISIKRRIGTTILTSFLLFSFTNSLTNFIMHGFYSQRQIPNRFSFLYVFMLIIIAYETIITLKYINKKIKIIIPFIFFIALIPLYLNLDLSFAGEYENILKIISFGYCSAMLIIYSIILINDNKKFVKKLFPIIMLIEVVIGLAQIHTTTLSDSYIKQNDYTEAIEKYKTEEFYREEVLTTTVTNTPTLYGIKGITSFNSIINSETASILGRLGFASGENFYRYYGHTPITDSLFGIKYIYSKYDEVLPFNFVKTDTINGINVYLNKYILPIGFDIEISSLDLNYANKFENLNNMAIDYGTLFRGLPIETTATSETAQIAKEDNSNYEVSCKSGEEFSFEINPIEENNVYIYTKSNGSCNLTIKLNDRIITSSSYSGYISYLGNLTKNDKITIKYSAKSDFSNKDVTIFLSSMNNDIFEAYYYDTLDHSVKNVEYNGNKISCDYTAENDTQLIFSVPYDKGWDIYIDGKEVKTKSIMDAFIGVDINEGYHEIQLVYIPYGFGLGWKTSIFSLSLCFIYIIVCKKNQKNKKTTIKLISVL